MTKFRKFGAMTSALLFLEVEAVLAWENEGSAVTAENDIEVVNVYAQRRMQNITDVALAVTSIDSDTLEKRHLKDTTELAALIPNVKITNNAGEGTPPAFNIRGVGMIDYNTSTISPIAVYSDDIVGGSANNLSVNLFDMDHVEVLRGPQGTLFGRNTTGGAILLMSKQPEKEFGGYVSASVGEHQQSSLDGALNVPINASTAMRFAINREDYQFSTNNLMPGAPNGGLTQTNLRLTVKTELENVTITAKIHAEDWSGSPKPIGSLGVIQAGTTELCAPNQAGKGPCTTAFGFQVPGDDYWDVMADTADRTHDTDSWGVSVKLAWELSPSIRLNAITGYNNLNRFHSWDSDGPGNFIEGSMGLDNSLFSQEFNITVQDNQTYWVTGLYYVTEDLKQNNDLDLFRDFRAIAELSAIPAQFFYRNRLKNNAMAIYSQIDYPLAEKFTITAGLRYTDESTDYHAVADLDIVPVYIAKLWDIEGEVADGQFSGKLALNQKIDENTSLYYSYSRGYKSGGYNAGYTTSPEQAADSDYAPETLNAYELGSKMRFWHNNARLNLAAFYYDYQDQQIFVNMTTGVAPYHVLKNAGDSTIYGVEGEFQLTPTNNSQFNLNVGYLPGANIGAYQDQGIIVDDNRLPFSSKWNVSAELLHDIACFGGVLTAQIGFDFQSRFYFDQNENPYTEQRAFTLWHGSLNFQVNDQFSVALWGKNLANTQYSELRFDSLAALGAVTELKGESRQLGLSASYYF